MNDGSSEQCGSRNVKARALVTCKLKTSVLSPTHTHPAFDYFVFLIHMSNMNLCIV